jgi:hypothetical protein
MGGQCHAPATLPPWKIRYPLYGRLDGAPAPVWTGEKNLAPTGIRSPDHALHSESLYRILYPGAVKVREIWIYLHFMWRLSLYLPQNSVLTLERTVGKCCTGKQWLFILRITRNTWNYLDVWQHAVFSVIKEQNQNIVKTTFLYK